MDKKIIILKVVQISRHGFMQSSLREVMRIECSWADNTLCTWLSCWVSPRNVLAIVIACQTGPCQNTTFYSPLLRLVELGTSGLQETFLIQPVRCILVFLISVPPKIGRWSETGPVGQAVYGIVPAGMSRSSVTATWPWFFVTQATLSLIIAMKGMSARRNTEQKRLFYFYFFNQCQVLDLLFYKRQFCFYRSLTPSLPQPVKCPGWEMHGHASKQ